MKITQYLGESPWGDVTPATIAKSGMGGRETCLVKISELWAEKGHEVVNLVSVEEPYTRRTDAGGSITYASSTIATDYLTNFETNVLVSWEEPRILAVPEIRKNVEFGCIEMQVAHLLNNMPGYDQFIDGYVCLSEWAAEFLAESDKKVPRQKISIIPNGVDLEKFQAKDIQPVGKGPYKFHYSSSPDRGLHHLLKIWPQVLDTYPGSELSVAYGVEGWANSQMWSHYEGGQMVQDILHGLSQPGVKYLGKIGQDELSKVVQDSAALLYPCDTIMATETGCITVIESVASGTPVVITDCDCLESEFQDIALIHPLPFRPDGYIQVMQTLLDNPQLYLELQKRGLEFAQKRSWDIISNMWLDYFSTHLD